jgi:hypothetical protein
METTGTDPDHYLQSIEAADIRNTMIELDTIIRTALPGRGRDLWQGTFWGGTDQTIIGYGRILQPRPRHPDVTWFLVGLARQKRNYSLYINATIDDGYLAHAYANRLGNVKLGAASIGFATLAKVNLDGLRDLLETAHNTTPTDSW